MCTQSMKHSTALYNVVALVCNGVSAGKEGNYLETVMAILHYHEISAVFYEYTIPHMSENLRAGPSM